MEVQRPDLQGIISNSLKSFAVVALLGARQVGKTTLARLVAQDLQNKNSEIHTFDLEDPSDLARLANPKLSLEPLRGLIIIDEIQRQPDLFPLLRVLADRKPAPARFLILGSASRDLINQSSESLAGRIMYIEIPPLGLSENSLIQMEQLWIRGGYPRSYLASAEEESANWREQYIRTFLERDIPQLGINIPAMTLRRFWMMLAHYHGQTLNYSEIGRSLDLSDATIKRYCEILSGTFMVRRLQPWFENIGKRQVKTPKIFIRDSGILHSLLQITKKDQIESNPKLGASWEGFAQEEILKSCKIREEEAFFWSVHQQGELDLLLFLNGRRVGIEFKYTDSPRLTPSMKMSRELLKLSELILVHPGAGTFPLDTNTRAMGLREALAELRS